MVNKKNPNEEQRRDILAFASLVGLRTLPLEAWMDALPTCENHPHHTTMKYICDYICDEVSRCHLEEPTLQNCKHLFCDTVAPYAHAIGKRSDLESVALFLCFQARVNSHLMDTVSSIQKEHAMNTFVQ